MRSFIPALPFLLAMSLNAADHAISDTVAHPAPWYTHIIDPHAVHHGGTTYMAYHGADPDYYDPYVLAYDHAAGTVAGPFKIGDNPLGETDPPDSHGNPAINHDGAGHLHVIYGGHGDWQGHQRHCVSVAPGDPSAWKQLDNINPKTTYPTLLNLGGTKMLLAYRAGGHRADWKYVESADNGATFGEEVVFFKAGTRRRDKKYYDKVYYDSWYPLFLQGADGSLHFIARYHACADDWEPHIHHLHRRQNLYYVRRDPEGVWRNLAGEEIALPVTLEVAEQRCRILASKEVDHAWRWETNDVQADTFGPDGRIHLVLGIGIGFPRHIQTRRYVLLTIDPNEGTVVQQALPDVGVVDSPRLGCDLTILDDGRYRIIGGKDALFSADRGATWTENRDFLPVAVQRVTKVHGGGAAARFMAVGVRDSSERSANRLYLWGEKGFLRGTRESGTGTH